MDIKCISRNRTISGDEMFLKQSLLLLPKMRKLAVLGIIFLLSIFSICPALRAETPEYLIITRELFADEIQPLLLAKENLGLTVSLYTLNQIDAYYPGTDIQEKIRNCIIDRHLNNCAEWVLLVGSPDSADNPFAGSVVNPAIIDKEWEMPFRYIYCPTDDYNYVPSDMYYSCLDGDWDSDGDDIYGENPSDCNNGIDEIDWIPDISLGRIPARSEQQVVDYVNKLLTNSSSNLELSELNALQISCSLNNELVDVNVPGLVLANIPPYETPTPTRIDLELNSGNYPILTFTGHGNTGHWSVSGRAWPGPYLYSSSWDSAFLCYAAACSTSYIDNSNTTSTIAENLLFKQDCGTIGYIGAYRLSNPTQNDLWREFWRAFFEQGITQPGATLASAQRSYYFWKANSHHFWYKNTHITQLIYNHLGDPHIRIGNIQCNGPKIVSVPATWVQYLQPYQYDDDNRAEAIGAGTITWQKISGPDYFDISEDGIVSWIPDPYGGEPNNRGRPTIAIRATDDNGSTDQRWNVGFCWPNMLIVSTPSRQGFVGIPYHYDEDHIAEVVDRPSARWKKVVGPPELNVNLLSGEVSWIPTTVGEHEIVIAAFDSYSVSHYADFQRFVVQVSIPGGFEPGVEDFETGDFNTFPWEHHDDASWIITSYEKHSGAYSAQAGAIDHDERTTLQVLLDCISGDITFYHKVSSEPGCDYLEFYIDGVKEGEWSSTTDWEQVSFPVRAGTRTFEWTYSKDGSVSEDDDTAWIDDIVFPVDSGPEPSPPSPTPPPTPPDDQFSVEDFETNDFKKLPWEHEGDNYWTTTLWEKHSGNYSAQAGSIEHDEITTLKVTLDCVEGNITFYSKTSSERGCDYLTFYIDREEKRRWSGTDDWAEVSFPVTAGTRTFKWTYSKDGSVSSGDDTAWIDDIVFPVN